MIKHKFQIGYLILLLLIINYVGIKELLTPFELPSNDSETVLEAFNKVLVTATMYNAVEAQCDADPLITAANYKINPKKASEHNWVALSRNLLKRWGGEFDYGDKILITNAGHKDGIYIVADTMHPRFKNRIDFLETLGTPLYKFHDVLIEKI